MLSALLSEYIGFRHEQDVRGQNHLISVAKSQVQEL